MAKTQCLARIREVRHDIPHVISIDFEPCGMPSITSVGAIAAPMGTQVAGFRNDIG